LLDCLAEWLTAGQPAIGLDRERDHRWHGEIARCEGYADRFVGVGHRHDRHHVGLGLGEGGDLDGVIGAGRIGLQVRGGAVAVALRSDAAADDDRRDVGGELLA
jgi:hypothetical protein